MLNYSIKTMVVAFKFVLYMKDVPMVEMFKMLETSGLRKFLSCSVTISDLELDQLFNTTMIENRAILYKVQCTNFSINQKDFADIFELSATTLTSCASLPDGSAELW